jgi:mannose-6-phosphate isomerase-like protein (cupin superfamily)
MAADLARNLKEVERATRDLMAWGAMEMHHYAVNTHFVVRLGDGRVTPALHMGLHTTASGKQ